MSKIVDALSAARVAMEYLAEKGILVWSREIRSIFRNSGTWVVEMDSPQFVGSIIIKSETGEVAKELML